MDLALMQRVLPFFLEAAWVTVQISVLALLLGFVIAGLLVAGRLSNNIVFVLWPVPMSASFVAPLSGSVVRPLFWWTADRSGT